MSLTEKTRHQISASFARQWRQASSGDALVKCCECPVVAHIKTLYRCLYCGLWRCQSCAERHFGKTRQQYLEEQL